MPQTLQYGGLTGCCDCCSEPAINSLLGVYPNLNGPIQAAFGGALIGFGTIELSVAVYPATGGPYWYYSSPVPSGTCLGPLTDCVTAELDIALSYVSNCEWTFSMLARCNNGFDIIPILNVQFNSLGIAGDPTNGPVTYNPFSWGPVPATFYGECSGLASVALFQ